jgi:cytochrome c oxidase subunit 3
MAVVTEGPKTAETVGEATNLRPGTAPPRPPGGGSGDGGFGGDGRNRAPGPLSSFPLSKERLATWLLLTGITMLFAGLASAYIITSGTPWWESVPLPRLLWLNTFVLLASSVTIERTRQHIQRDRPQAARVWISLTGVLGVGFLLGQLQAWQELIASGVFLQSTLHSSFFFILTGLHGLHLIGGISALAYVWARIFQNRYSSASHEPVSLTTMYWHFMDGLWVCMFLMLILV